jgi:Flp pilus assembly protein TadG
MVKFNSRNDRGSAFVELALVLPLLSLVLVGAAELGRIAYFAIEVSNAARAGAAYGAQNGSTSASTNAAAVTAAALADAPELATAATSFTATPATLEDCETVNSNSGAVTENPSTPVPYPMVTPCATSTTNGVTNTIVNYIQVTTQAQVKTMFRYPGIPTSFTLNGFAQMRVIQN